MPHTRLVLSSLAAFTLCAWSTPSGADEAQVAQGENVYAFISTKMPANKPGSLEPDEYYDILAFDLKANGVDVGDEKLDAASAAQIKLH